MASSTWSIPSGREPSRGGRDVRASCAAVGWPARGARRSARNARTQWSGRRRHEHADSFASARGGVLDEPRRVRSCRDPHGHRVPCWAGGRQPSRRSPRGCHRIRRSRWHGYGRHVPGHPRVRAAGPSAALPPPGTGSTSGVVVASTYRSERSSWSGPRPAIPDQTVDPSLLSICGAPLRWLRRFGMPSVDR